jgi:hypothetical protein
MKLSAIGRKNLLDERLNLTREGLENRKLGFILLSLLLIKAGPSFLPHKTLLVAPRQRCFFERQTRPLEGSSSTTLHAFNLRPP